MTITAHKALSGEAVSFFRLSLCSTEAFQAILQYLNVKNATYSFDANEVSDSGIEAIIIRSDNGQHFVDSSESSPFTDSSGRPYHSLSTRLPQPKTVT